MLIFSLDPDDALAPALAADLDRTLAPLEERVFADGEIKLRPLADPRGADAYVVASLHGGPQLSPHDRLCRLLLFAAALRQNGAARVSAVVPYLAYARKDRQTKPFDPLSLRWLAQVTEASGVDQAIVLEAHNVAAFQNAFRCPTIHLDAHPAFEALAHELAATGPLSVASPDPGGVKRAQLWREALQESLGRSVGFAVVDKRRSGGLVSGGRIVAGEVAGSTVLLYDDLIASGETMQRAAQALRHAGARSVVACAAHGLFVDPAAQVLADAAIDRVAVTDSVPPFRLAGAGAALHDKLTTVSAVPLFARALRSSHEGWRR
ncbi:MAG: ribose-phosphate diphosphokinase [Betaproteobacteria bacterium]